MPAGLLSRIIGSVRSQARSGRLPERLRSVRSTRIDADHLQRDALLIAFTDGQRLALALHRLQEVGVHVRARLDVLPSIEFVFAGRHSANTERAVLVGGNGFVIGL